MRERAAGWLRRLADIVEGNGSPGEIVTDCEPVDLAAMYADTDGEDEGEPVYRSAGSAYINSQCVYVLCRDCGTHRVALPGDRCRACGQPLQQITTFSAPFNLEPPSVS